MTTDLVPHWDVSNVYPGLESPEFEQAVGQLRAQLDQVDGYLSTHHIERGRSGPFDADELSTLIGGYLDLMNAAQRLGYTLRSYVQAFVTTDSYNTTARRLMSELEPLAVRLENQEMLFRGWIGAVAEQSDLFAAALDRAGVVQDHSFCLREMAAQSRYLMPAAEEALAAELSLSGARAWQRLQGVIVSQLRVPFERDGHVQDLPITVLQNLRTDPDEAVRRRAHQAELEAWRSVQEPLAACLNGVKGAVNSLDGRRGRTDALHQALDQARIDRDTLAAMLGAMRDSFPAFRQYWHAKARLTGKSALPWWDLSAPVGRSTRRYSYAEAQALILEQLAGFSGRLAGLAQRAFEHNWIDAEPRSGKRGGAFCMGLPALEESRILCNFDGSLDQVFTLAHELGHAYHNECHSGKPPLQRRTPMTLAETASIFNETILTNAALTQARDPGEELAILDTFLLGSSQVVVDIYSRYLFETEVLERRARAELSADDLCEIMTRAQKETYGDGLDQRYLHPYMWAWKPHYYMPHLSFYNFPYAFGLLFGLGLYAVYQERGPSFLPEYDSLLRSTGEATAADLAARFGIELRERRFWEGSLGTVRARIDRYCSLVESGGP